MNTKDRNPHSVPNKNTGRKTPQEVKDKISAKLKGKCFLSPAAREIIRQKKLGQKCSAKLTTDELKKKAYKAYCDWLAQGKSSRSFTFEEGDLQCIGQTIENYMEREPANFPAINRNIAFSKGMGVWESVVEDSAKGKNRAANTASLQMLMRNKYGWDKQEKKDDDEKKLADLKAHALEDEQKRNALKES